MLTWRTPPMALAWLLASSLLVPGDAYGRARPAGKDKAPPPAKESACETVRRAAFDFGSGTVKLRVHDVVIRGHEVVSSRLVAGGEDSVRVDFEADLRGSKNDEFSEAIQEQGLAAAKKLKAAAEALGAKEFAGLATDAFRSAGNAKAFLRRIWQETKINLRISSIEEEARLGFHAAKAAGGYDPQKLVVWDVGGGAVTLTTLDDEDGFVVWSSTFGSVNLRDAIVRRIQRRRATVTSPNPMSKSDVAAAMTLVGREATQTDLPPALARKLKQRGVKVVGIGPVHCKSVARQVKGRLTPASIDKVLQGRIGKTDRQIGGEYADTDVSNLAMVLAYMRTLGVRELRVADVNVADGVLYALYYW